MINRKAVFENFNSFIKRDEVLNEERENVKYTFVANKDSERGTHTPGFTSMKSFMRYSKDGYFNGTPGYDKGMELKKWAETKGFRRCEEDVREKAADDNSIKSLDRFKEKFPEKYYMMIMYMTHDPLPRSATEEGERWRRFSPIGKGGGGITGKDIGNVYATDLTTVKPMIGPEEDQKPAEEGANSCPVDLKIPTDIDTSSFFEFNSWDLSDSFKRYIANEIITPLKQLLQEAKPLNPSDPKAFLESLKVFSSCSTIPNKTSPDGKKYSFKDLSKKRSETAIKYISDELKKIGVLVDNDSKATIFYNGENSGKKVIKGYGSLVKGVDLTGTSGPEWDGKNTEEVKKFQRVQVKARVLVNTSKMEKEEKPKEDDNKINPATPPIIEDEFKVVASFSKFKFEMPRIGTIKLPRFGIFGKREFKPVNQLKCPKFGLMKQN